MVPSSHMISISRSRGNELIGFQGRAAIGELGDKVGGFDGVARCAVGQARDAHDGPHGDLAQFADQVRFVRAFG